MAASKTGIELAKLIAGRIGSNTKSFDRVLEKVKIVSAGDGKCVAEMKVEPEHQNVHGSLHGGMISTLVDIVSSLALVTHQRPGSESTDLRALAGVSVDLHVTFLKAAKEGEEILVDAYTLKAGKNLAFLNVDIKKKATGEMIAKGSHTKFIG